MPRFAESAGQPDQCGPGCYRQEIRAGLRETVTLTLEAAWAHRGSGRCPGAMLEPMFSATVDEAALPVWARDRRLRRAEGRAARDRAPRRELGRWDTVEDSRDAVAMLLAQNTIRAEELLPMRNGRMAATPWTFYRGAAAVMAADLGSRPHSGLTVQLCGDAHLLNFGLWATPERNLSFDLRDFDETLPGPFEWDVARLVASIVVLARTYGVRADRAEAAVAACLRTYRERMTGYTTARWLDIWYDLIAVDQFLGVFTDPDKISASAHIERKGRKRTHRGAFRKFTEHRDGHLIAYGKGAPAVGLALSLKTWSDQVTACTDGSRRMAAASRNVRAGFRRSGHMSSVPSQPPS